MNDSVPDVQIIPIDQINILNPRSRNETIFQTIVSNISSLGLKKPITVARRPRTAGGKAYDLVCGQGRLEAFQALGQTEIPGIVIDAPREDCFLLSLVENVARRHHSPLELLSSIVNLKTRGYGAGQIAEKIDLNERYVAGVCNLLERGEERLLSAVEKGRIPLSVALRIASSDEAGVQQALCEAYEGRSLRGRKLKTVQRILGSRRARGKKLAQGHHPTEPSPSSAEAMVRLYRQEADRQRVLVKKAQLTTNRLLLVVSALKKLLTDKNYVTLLHVEGLDTLPTYLAEKIQKSDGAQR